MAYPDMYYAPPQGMGRGNQQPGMGDANYTSVRPAVQQPRATYIPGRMIQQEEEIIPSEVPMNGDYATFISQDMKRIYMKTWGKDGLIHTEVFENVTDRMNSGMNQQPQMDALAAIMARLDEIEKCLKRPPRPPKKPYNKQNAQNNKEG